MKGWDVLAIVIVVLALALLVLWRQTFVEFFDGPGYWQWRIVVKAAPQ